jgi:DNA-binding SARP family transcriptional activator
MRYPILLPVPSDVPGHGAPAYERLTADVLGPVEVSAGGHRLALQSGKIRCLAAILALNGGRPVSLPRLIDVLWTGDPPASAGKNVHQYVYRLRAMLAQGGLAGRLAWQPAGYVLQLHPGELDLGRFEALTAMGRRARDEGDLVAAADALTEALGLWRADPLSDVRDSRPLDETAHALSERRMCVVEERIAIDLRLRRFGPLVPQLAVLVAEHPLRERLREYQMLALYGSGRRADALAVYHDCRSVLAREIGIDPGPALTALLSRMLTDDDALTASPSPVPKSASAAGRMPGRRFSRSVVRPPSRSGR